MEPQAAIFYNATAVLKAKVVKRIDGTAYCPVEMVKDIIVLILVGIP